MTESVGKKQAERAEKMHGKNAWMGTVFVLTAGVCWGFIGFFSSHLSGAGYSPVQLAFLRNIVASVAMWGYLLIFRRETLKINWKDLWMFIGTGTFSVVFFNIAYFMTIEQTTLLYTAPCFVMVMSALLFHEKVTRTKGAALVLALFGCACTTGIFHGVGGSVPAFGIFTGIASGFCYALYSIFGHIALKKYGTVTVTAYTFLVAAVSLLPFINMGEIAALTAEPSVLGNIIAIYFLYHGTSEYGAGKGICDGLCGTDGGHAGEYFYFKGRIYMDGNGRGGCDFSVHCVVECERA